MKPKNNTRRKRKVKNNKNRSTKYKGGVIKHYYRIKPEYQHCLTNLDSEIKRLESKLLNDENDSSIINEEIKKKKADRKLVQTYLDLILKPKKYIPNHLHLNFERDNVCPGPEFEKERSTDRNVIPKSPIDELPAEDIEDDDDEYDNDFEDKDNNPLVKKRIDDTGLNNENEDEYEDDYADDFEDDDPVNTKPQLDLEQMKRDLETLKNKIAEESGKQIAEENKKTPSTKKVYYPPSGRNPNIKQPSRYNSNPPKKNNLPIIKNDKPKLVGKPAWRYGANPNPNPFKRGGKKRLTIKKLKKDGRKTRSNKFRL